MNLGKLTKRLKKELGANPKQAAALAVVCLVGLWFWWPLLTKWLRPKAAEPKATDAKPSTEQPADPALPAVVETTARREQPDFTKVPDEVLDFFKNTEGRPVRRAYLFDPIFQPVMPNDLPKSKATSQQK